MDNLEKNTEVFNQLKKFIIEVIGEDFAEELDIQPSSIFTKDLDMDSIEIVSFAEKVKNYYGDKINFNSWLSEMSMDQIITLSINDIINYIVDVTTNNK